MWCDIGVYSVEKFRSLRNRFIDSDCNYELLSKQEEDLIDRYLFLAERIGKQIVKDSSGNLFLVLDIVTDTTIDDECILYKSLTGAMESYVMPIHKFLGKVDNQLEGSEPDYLFSFISLR